MARAATSKKSSLDPLAQELAEAKLAESDLTLDDARLLGIEPLSGQQAKQQLGVRPLAGLKITYFTPTGEPTGFWRYRFLEKGDSGFDALVQKDKSQRYTQAVGTLPAVYFARQMVDWPILLEDPDKRLIITEGELKAACACNRGFATMGLGGVWNWRSAKQGVTWLPDLDLPVWKQRHVYICFDSDFKQNPGVLAALESFATQLVNRGAYVYLTSLPEIPGLSKTGLDDFLANENNEAFDAVLRLSEMHGLAEPLWDLNNRYTYIKDPGLILDHLSLAKVTPAAFTQHREATSIYLEKFLQPNGDPGHREVAAAQSWLKWPLRQEAQCLTYEPGQPQFINTNGAPAFNIWPGWGVEPRAGDVEPFLKLVDHLFTGAEPAAKDWFLRWCAYPLQHPGVKLFSSAVLHGIKHGTGKSLLGYTLGRIYGKNFTEISQTDLHASFNEWAEGKQLVMGDDVTGSNKRQDADFLKKLITQRELRVNIKYVPSYTVPDCINYFFTANHPDAFFLEDDDRRYFIHEVTVGGLDEAFYAEYDLWLDTGGSQAVFDYLLHLDLGDFNPAGRAYQTTAKDRMIADLRSDLASWVRLLLAEPDAILRVGQVRAERDLWTTRELLGFYDPEQRSGVTANGLGRELTRAGCRQVCEGRPVRLPDGTQARFYIVRNKHLWENAQPADVAAHVSGKPAKKPRKY